MSVRRRSRWRRAESGQEEKNQKQSHSQDSEAIEDRRSAQTQQNPHPLKPQTIEPKPDNQLRVPKHVHESPLAQTTPPKKEGEEEEERGKRKPQRIGGDRGGAKEGGGGGGRKS